jgi:DDE superfamily endonuclease
MFEHRPDSERLYVFGDSAYTGSYATIGCYRKPRGRQLTESQRQFNGEMSSTRVSVEHGFGRIQNLWQSQGFHLTKRMGSTPVAAYYLAAVLLTNLMTCLRGHQISIKFNCKPPSLDEYFASSRYAVQRAYSAELGVWDENNGRRSPSEASFTDVCPQSYLQVKVIYNFHLAS